MSGAGVFGAGVFETGAEGVFDTGAEGVLDTLTGGTGGAAFCTGGCGF